MNTMNGKVQVISNVCNLIITIAAIVWRGRIGEYIFIFGLAVLVLLGELIVIWKYGWLTRGFCLLGLLVVGTLLLFDIWNPYEGNFPMVKRGTLNIHVEELMIRDKGESSTHELTKEISGNLKVEDLKLDYQDYDAAIKKYDVEDNVIVLDNVPKGKCDLEIVLKDYTSISAHLTLREADLTKRNAWNETYVVEREGEYRDFQIRLLDQSGNILADERCTVGYSEDSEEWMEYMATDSEGVIPGVFHAAPDTNFEVKLEKDGQEYVSAVDLNAAGNDIIDVSFQDVTGNVTLEEQEKQQAEEKLKKQAEEARLEEEKNNPRLYFQNSELINTDFTSGGTVLTSFSGALNDDEREQNYSLDIASPIPIWIEFCHDNLTDDIEAWQVSLFDAGDNLCCQFNSKMNIEKTLSPMTGLKAGNYTIRIKDYGRFVDNPYAVNVLTTDERRFEEEENGEALTATKFEQLKSDQTQTVCGALSYDSDKDYYAFDVKNPGVLCCDFEHENFTDEGVGWVISVLDKDFSLIAKMESKENTIRTVSPNIGMPKGSYYLAVERGWSGWNEGTYALNLLWKKSSYWNKEKDDEIRKATAIMKEYVYSASIETDDDVDYFKYEAEESEDVTLTFSHENLTEDRTGWEIELLDANSEKLILDEDHDTMYSKWNEPSKTSEGINLSAGTYYVKVKRGWDHTDEAYHIQLK